MLRCRTVSKSWCCFISKYALNFQWLSSNEIIYNHFRFNLENDIASKQIFILKIIISTFYKLVLLVVISGNSSRLGRTLVANFNSFSTEKGYITVSKSFFLEKSNYPIQVKLIFVQKEMNVNEEEKEV